MIELCTELAQVFNLLVWLQAHLFKESKASYGLLGRHARSKSEKQKGECQTLDQHLLRRAATAPSRAENWSNTWNVEMDFTAIAHVAALKVFMSRTKHVAHRTSSRDTRRAVPNSELSTF